MTPYVALTFHNGKLEVPEELQHGWQLREGSELRVVSSRPGQIVLELFSAAVAEATAAWDSLGGSVPDLRTPEWQAQATARKDRAAKRLEELYASKAATNTELRQAEREWEFADDDLDFGPFPQR